MTIHDDHDPELSQRLSEYADTSLADFDVAAVVRTAAVERPRRGWQLFATAAAAAVLVGGVMLFVSNQSNPRALGQSPAASASEETPASATPEAGTVTEEQAIALAREAAPHAADYASVNAESGAFGEMFFPTETTDFESQPSANRVVWVVMLSDVRGDLDASITRVVIDSVDGTVYDIANFRS